MTPTLTEIRTALQNLAMKKGRPDYEICTAKQVKFALDNGLDHPLIEDVLSLIAVLKTVAALKVAKAAVVKPKPRRHRVSKKRLAVKRKYPTTVQVKELVEWMDSYEDGYVALAKIADCSHSILCHIRLGTRNCTLEMYSKIMKAREELEGMAV